MYASIHPDVQMHLLQYFFVLSAGLFASSNGVRPPHQVQYTLRVGAGNLTAPLPCFVGRDTIVNVIECFDAYTVPSGAILTPDQYNAAQPNGVERDAWRLAISRLLGVDSTCAPELLPAELNDKYTITHYTELITERSFCILSETQLTPGGYFLRGWGLLVVPSTRAQVSRHIHISAPHPGRADPGSPQQAAAVFRNTGDKSLLISGRHRNAFAQPSACRPDFSVTDAAHNIVRPSLFLHLCFMYSSVFSSRTNYFLMPM